jgi:fibronectin-binding autotransporter adhesin
MKTQSHVKKQNGMNLVSIAIIAFAIIAFGPLARAQVTATYSPTNWVNDPNSTNSFFGAPTGANTTSPTYTASGGTPTQTQTLYGYSPIGSTITLNAPGQTITLTGQVTLNGSGTPGNNQFRYGLFYKGAQPADTGWLGYFNGNENGAGGAGVYARIIPNSNLFGSGTGANVLALAGQFLYSTGFADPATYNMTLSVTYVNSSQTLLRWTLQGISGNTYLYSGIYTNNTPSAQGGFSFDEVGFLGGSTTFAAGTTPDIIGFSNMQVTVGNFGNSTWTNNASGNWSTAGNWTNAAAANGAGFNADFSQVNLAADTTVTLDANYTLGSLTFGATSGSTHNWFLASSGGSVLTLSPQLSVPAAAAPVIAVKQNTATILLPFVSSNGLTMSGNGTLVLGGTNTIVGPLNLNGGELNFLSLSNLSLISGDISSINFSNGALQWASGNTLDISSLGIPISFAGTAGFDTGPNNITFANNFGDGGVGGLKKLGAGTLTLNGSASYTGTTTVGAGVLAIGSSGSISSSTNITINSGATLNVSAAGLALNSG